MNRLPSPRPRRVFLLGATGTMGRATARALVLRGHDVVCFVRPAVRQTKVPKETTVDRLPIASTVRFGDATDPKSLAQGFGGEPFDVLVSCLASRSGVPADAWAVDYQANVDALSIARDAGVKHVVLLSAICVQRPLLAFQHAKLAYEKCLTECGTAFSIVRPTAFFKSLCGQVERVKRGKPFLLFGDGRGTSCKPISDNDLAEYIVDCLDDESRWNRVLPIGGPGAAITPRQQGEHLFALLKRPPNFRHVPVSLLDGIARVLGTVGHIWPSLAAKAELARIGRYYATESMLVLDPETGKYEDRLTPSTGSETLFDFYARLIGGLAAPARGDHAVFKR